jgi:SH3-like domain-containing protein
MFVRKLLSASCLSLAIFAAPSVLVAQSPDPAPEIENARFRFVGAVNSNAVFVRSGPSESDYATMQLNRGDEVTVVGLKFDWLKITPPDGSFCYVAKAYIERRGEGGKIGRVTNVLNVRVGSSLNAMKTRLAMKLDPGTDVEIIDEADEYFKIKPPEGVFLYVNKQFVDPVRRIGENPDNMAQAPSQPNNGNNSNVPGMPSDAGVASQTPPSATDATSPYTTSPDATAGAPTTSPAVATNDEAEFERLETLWKEASAKSLEEQTNLVEISGGYAKLAESTKLPESLKRIADAKAKALRARNEAREEFLAVKKQQDAMAQKHQVLKAEQEELEQRIKTADVTFYTAVGILRPSSLQYGAGTLWRLTDPSTARTVVYLRSDDSRLAGLNGVFIAVRGEVNIDSNTNLRIIAPTTIDSVDPGQVNKSIAAQIVPPSMMPQPVQASSGN